MNEDLKHANDLILSSLKEKSSVKQDVYALTKQRFADLKRVLQEFSDAIGKEAHRIDERLKVNFIDKGEFECQLQVAGDVLVFHMHTNVFMFDSESNLWKTSYLKDDSSRAYCGIINVFNFLADSFRYNRMNDLGYLVARIFVNRENHFLVQGKRQLGFLYNDFISSDLTYEKLMAVVQSIVLYAIDFDLFTPPYDLVKEVSVMEIREMSDMMQIKTGKRLGFKFQADSDDF
ncbi:MAG: hypothetical protein K1X56_01400 [Flavobacteriales bacterium]|nr:hypothetical protein [Flavobacteriales bacterium]